MPGKRNVKKTEEAPSFIYLVTSRIDQLPTIRAIYAATTSMKEAAHVAFTDHGGNAIIWKLDFGVQKKPPEIVWSGGSVQTPPKNKDDDPDVSDFTKNVLSKVAEEVVKIVEDW